MCFMKLQEICTCMFFKKQQGVCYASSLSMTGLSGLKLQLKKCVLEGPDIQKETVCNMFMIHNLHRQKYLNSVS